MARPAMKGKMRARCAFYAVELAAGDVVGDVGGTGVGAITVPAGGAYLLVPTSNEGIAEQLIVVPKAFVDTGPFDLEDDREHSGIGPMLDQIWTDHVTEA